MPQAYLPSGRFMAWCLVHLQINTLQPLLWTTGKGRRLISTGRQPMLYVGNTDPTSDWAIDQRSLPFRQPLEGDLQMRERHPCQE